MTGKRAITFLDGLDEARIKPGLERMRASLSALNDPHLNYPQILVGGTNGKGSVVNIIGSILARSGIRAGLYTSPHLHRFEERIVTGVDVLSEDDADFLVERVRRTGVDLSYFEFATTMALEHFSRQEVDLAVLEVGLGGRWDATNVTEPFLSVITTVGLDHQDYLGATISQVAAEKAQIARPGKPLVLGPMDDTAEDVIRGHARAIGSRVIAAGKDFNVSRDNRDGDLTYSGRGLELAGLRPALEGWFQANNLGVAIAAVQQLEDHGFKVTPEEIVKGVERAIWPGRFQRFPGKPPLVVDSAHNVPAMQALVSELRSRDIAPVWLFGAMADKDVTGLFEVVMRRPGPVVAVPVDHPRAMAVDELARLGEKAGVPVTPSVSVPAGFETAGKLAGSGRTVVCAGSVFLAAEVLRLAGQKENNLS
jgi:dihydrofolate synthase/folylpolyglutamate synthase